MPRTDLDRPIVVLGAPRSGTTLIANVLSSHPDCALAKEPRLVWRFGNDAKSDQLRPEDATPRVIEHARRKLAAIVADGQAERLVEKSPSNSVRPAFVATILPEARFVHVTRNGWAAVPSMRSFWDRRGTGFDQRQRAKTVRRLREAAPSQLPHYAAEFARRFVRRPGGHVPLYGPRLAGLREIVDEQGVLVASALQWRTCVEQSATFGRRLDPDRYLEIRLEELTPTVIEQLAAFCELADPTELLRHFEAVHDPGLATGRQALDPAQVAAVAPYIEPANVLLGYPTEPG